MWKDVRRGEHRRQLVILLDIDNTLYDNAFCGDLNGQMRAALTDHISRSLLLSSEEAGALVARYLEKYGLTVCGLVYEKVNIDPESVVNFVYDRCDFSGLRRDPALRAMLSRLREDHHLYYLTNAGRRHADRVLQEMGLDTPDFGLRGFTYEDQWERTTPNVSNKPMRAAYSAIYGAVRNRMEDPAWLSPENMVMVDDSACNLIEPLAMNWRAVWVSHGAALPEILVEPMKTGKLACVEHIGELEDVICRFAQE